MQVLITARSTPLASKGSPHYPLEVALDVCRRHQLIEGQVFVLGRLGAHAEALRLMLESSQGDLRAAIDFVRQRPQEVELWQVGAADEHSLDCL
jgi:hypothetical protein